MIFINLNLLTAFLVLVYLAPTLLAALRRNRNTFNVCVINIWLGWSVIGWLWAFNEALTDAISEKAG